MIHICICLLTVVVWYCSNSSRYHCRKIWRWHYISFARRPYLMRMMYRIVLSPRTTENTKRPSIPCRETGRWRTSVANCVPAASTRRVVGGNEHSPHDTNFGRELCPLVYDGLHCRPMHKTNIPPPGARHLFLHSIGLLPECFVYLYRSTTCFIFDFVVFVKECHSCSF